MMTDLPATKGVKMTHARLELWIEIVAWREPEFVISGR
jgi:hypothetical protein